MIKIKWLLTRGKGLGVTGLIVCVCVRVVGLQLQDKNKAKTKKCAINNGKDGVEK